MENNNIYLWCIHHTSYDHALYYSGTEEEVLSLVEQSLEGFDYKSKKDSTYIFTITKDASPPDYKNLYENKIFVGIYPKSSSEFYIKEKLQGIASQVVKDRVQWDYLLHGDATNE